MFYARLAEATRNEVMVILVRAITEILRGILLEVSPMPRSETVKTFRNVIAALRKRDSERARQVMRAHLRDLHEYLARAREAAVR
jgi:DNA-binding FadR family transcriptional regulator